MCKEMDPMADSRKEPTEHVTAEIEVTNCPDCGTEWEVVVTEHPRLPAPRRRREE